MDNVAKYLKYESTKYSDLPSILGKLESQGYLNDIYGLFRKIYEEESSFTMQELAKFAQQNPQNEKFNIESQFQLNIAIFKANFLLINQMLIDSIWGNMSSSAPSSAPSSTTASTSKKASTQGKATKKKAKKEQNKTEVDAETEVDIHQENTSDAKEDTQQSDDRVVSPKKQENSVLSSRASSQGGKRLRSSSPPLSHLSVKNKEFMEWGNKSAGGNSEKLVDKRTKRSLNLNANPASPLYTILYGEQSQRHSSSNLNKTPDSAKSRQLDRSALSGVNSTSQFQNIMNQSVTSMNRLNSSLNTSAHNTSKLSVQSEFNHVQGAATFGNSKRKLMETKEKSPGPAAYHSEKSVPSQLKRSPSPTFGNAKKGSWVDIATAQSSSPGPGQFFPSHQFVAK